MKTSPRRYRIKLLGIDFAKSSDASDILVLQLANDTATLSKELLDAARELVRSVKNLQPVNDRSYAGRHKVVLSSRIKRLMRECDKLDKIIGGFS